jgi:hypothetical protein
MPAFALKVALRSSNVGVGLLAALRARVLQR